MSIEVKNADLLPGINEAQMSIYAVEILSTLGGCVSFGPFKLCADVKISPPSARVILSRNGNQLAECQLDETHQECDAKWGNGYAKIDVKLKLDLPGKRITAKGTACIHVPVLGWQCMSHTMTVYSW